jgi:hypothetical protein
LPDGDVEVTKIVTEQQVLLGQPLAVFFVLA